MRRSCWRLAIAIAIALGACGSDGDDPAKKASEQPRLTDTRIQRHVTLKISGARSLEFDGVRGMRFLRRPGKGETLKNSVASMTFDAPFDLANGRLAEAEVAVVGIYTGDGTYDLPAGIGRKPATGTTLPDDPTIGDVKLSVAQTTFFAPDSDPKSIRFEYLLAPCKITLSEGTEVGSATCPELVAFNGEKVSMELTWKKP